ncbi:corticotropin-releasing factor receptor 1-like [Galendromus occidentalis]|uniref:Corticotropin-releasing factor receptor 1-like n=1 Tax=Galendromus occidentalis TaxID=34638 RepID=A0AAJ6QT14_9ACAR|nr:corticotropin-releasing factor receptor 1-like [Galendromus occidentalis]
MTRLANETVYDARKRIREKNHHRHRSPPPPINYTLDLNLASEYNVYDRQYLKITDADECLALQPADVNNSLSPAGRFLSGTFCPPDLDHIACSPPVPANYTLVKHCEHIFRAHYNHTIPADLEPARHFFKNLYAFRRCGSDGSWINSTDYRACESMGNYIDRVAPEPMTPHQLLLGRIMLAGSCSSMFFLLITFYIFSRFRKLHCPRTKVHMCLSLSLFMYSLAAFATSLPNVVNAGHRYLIMPHIRYYPKFCKTTLTVTMYSSTSSVNWMFVEGLLLHSRLTTSIFRQDAPFRLYYFIGYVLPLFFVLPWAYIMEKTQEKSCWVTYGSSPYIRLLTIPRIVALMVNSLFLVNIVRIVLVSGRKRPETNQLTRAIKATAILFPLFGLTHLIYCMRFDDQRIYDIVNAFLHPMQGTFVSIIYCFMNAEVQNAVRHAYSRTLARRQPTGLSSMSQRSQRLNRNKNTITATITSHQASGRRNRRRSEPVDLMEMVPENRRCQESGGGVRCDAV